MSVEVHEQPAHHAPGAEQHGEACPRRHDRRRRVLALVVLTGGVGLLGTGAFASWQATAAATSATMGAATGAAAVVDASGGQLALPVANLVPGDWLYRYVDVQNNGSASGSFTGTVSAPGTLASGLLVTADACSATWNTTASTCPGTTTPLGSGLLSGAVGINHGSIAAGGVQHVRYRIDVSSAASSTLMGTSTSLSVAVVSDLVGNRDRTGG